MAEIKVDGLKFNATAVASHASAEDFIAKHPNYFEGFSDEENAAKLKVVYTLCVEACPKPKTEKKSPSGKETVS